MSAIIRLARVDDIDALFDIRTSVTQNHLSRAELDAMGITRETTAAMITDAPCVWIAEMDGVPAAFATASREEACVFAMFVRPAFEGRGLGRALMARVEAFLFQFHARIWLETDGRESIRANGFYRRLGWQPVSVKPNGDVRYEKGSPADAAPA